VAVIDWICKDDFEGIVKINKPSTRNCMILMKKMMFKGLEELSPVEKLDQGILIQDLIKPFIVSVSVKHKSGVQLNSWDEMIEESYCDKLVNDIIQFTAFGGKLGEV
jgi:hypothetical protein